MSSNNKTSAAQVYFRYDLVDVNDRVAKNDSTMANTLASSQATKRMDNCCGIHGAMKARRGAKKATSSARRRHDKKVIIQALED